MENPIRVVSTLNTKLYVDAIPGHFATNHSHVNYYMDMTAIKHKHFLAQVAAASMASHFNTVNVDTVLCVENTEYIGAYLARELSKGSLGAMNGHKEINLVEPESNVNGQFIFADNLRPMIDHKDVLVLISSASTGQTLAQMNSCVRYYGGRVVGYCALFSNIDTLDGKPVFHLFSGRNLPHYHNSVGAKDCPECLKGKPLDAMVTPHGYTLL